MGFFQGVFFDSVPTRNLAPVITTAAGTAVTGSGGTGPAGRAWPAQDCAGIVRRGMCVSHVCRLVATVFVWVYLGACGLSVGVRWGMWALSVWSRKLEIVSESSENIFMFTLGYFPLWLQSCRYLPAKFLFITSS